MANQKRNNPLFINLVSGNSDPSSSQREKKETLGAEDIKVHRITSSAASPAAQVQTFCVYFTEMDCKHPCKLI